MTLVDRSNGRAVRVTPKAEAMLANKRSEFFTKYREKGVPASQVPAEVVEPMIAKVMGAPDEMLMNIGDVVAHPLPKKVESFAGFVCDRCGEMTVEGYGRPLGDKKVCIPCYEQAMQER